MVLVQSIKYSFNYKILILARAYVTLRQHCELFYKIIYHYNIENIYLLRCQKVKESE